MLDGFNCFGLPLDVHKLVDRLEVSLNRQAVYSNLLGLILGFVQKVDENTGELRYIANLRGSFHTFKNKGTHNADSFDLCDFLGVLKDLAAFGINPAITTFNSIEFGVNIKLPYSPKRIIDAIRSYDGKPFEPLGNLGLQYVTSLYTFKIYDKGRKYKEYEHDNILRVEIRAKCSYLKREKVNVFASGSRPRLIDLLSVRCWERFEKLLLKAIDNITIVEATQPKGLTKKEHALLDAFAGDAWRTFNKHKLCRERKKYAALLERIGATKLKTELKEMIRFECEKLRCTDEDFRNQIKCFLLACSNMEINNADIWAKNENANFATESRFFQSEEKEHFRNRINIKIKADKGGFSCENYPFIYPSTGHPFAST